RAGVHVRQVPRACLPASRRGSGAGGRGAVGDEAGRQHRLMFAVRPIGTLHTPWRAIAECPRNGRQQQPAPPFTAVVSPEFVDGLRSIEGFSHLILLYWLDQARSPELVFTPPFDAQPRGVFATRGPRRPNPIGLSVVAFDGFSAP